MGEVNGRIEATERIEVYPPGRVGGDIQSPVISIEPGGMFNGSCVMKPPTATAPETSFFSKKKASVAESKNKMPAAETQDKKPAAEPNAKIAAAEKQDRSAFTELKNN
jgi:cytoskeletal protein CcmA (bactofilin family)